MYQWESVLCTNLFDASSVPNSLHLQNIHTYILLLHFSESSSISGKNMGSSIWSIVWLRHWNGAVSAFCQRQNANSFRKSEDLQPLLGLGAPPPHISHLVANQIQALSPFPQSCHIRTGSKNSTFLCLSHFGCWDLMLACFEVKQVSWKVSCLQQFIGQSWLLKTLKMEKGGLGRSCCNSGFSCNANIS